MKKIWEKVKPILQNVWKKIAAFLKTLTAKNLKDLAIAVLIFSLLVVGYQQCSLYKKGKDAERRAKEAQAQSEQDKIAKEKFLKYVKVLLKGIARRNKIIAEKNAKILEAEKDKQEIQDDYNQLLADLKKKSQIEKDKLLTEELKKNKIDVVVVAAQNYMKIIPQEREDLLTFAYDYKKIFDLNQKNELEIIPALKTQVDELKKNETDCNELIALGKADCDIDKRQLTTDLNNMTSARDILKKKLFWRKVGEIAATILVAIIVFK